MTASLTKKPTRLVVILGDQLNASISSLEDFNSSTDLILMAEVAAEATYVKHHKKKIAFLFAAMRHFAAAQQQLGRYVHYVQLDDKQNSGSISGEVKRLIAMHPIQSICISEPAEYRLLQEVSGWTKQFSIDVEIRADNRFLASKQDFATWAQGRKQLRMEYLYRDMRRRYNTLIQDGKPIGGQWNYDASNRKFPGQPIKYPDPKQIPADEITQAVIGMVRTHFKDHFGELEPFNFAVTRHDALGVLDHFIEHRLPQFGDYQDAMIENEPWMFHSLISFYVNCGLLMPLECIQAAEQAYHQGHAPLNAVEGFIRQVLGWREYIRGYYWLKMPDYAEQNFFNATRALPSFYWNANTQLNCVRQCVKSTQTYAYAHHIQRLMVLGNFALLAAIDPKQVNEWFLIVYADAYEWVELPNVSGMALFADGGQMSSKPYAASGSYINKMSNYCGSCAYNVKQRTGESACPFNYLYWDFIDRNRKLLQSNPRMAMIYRTLEKMDPDQVDAMRQQSQAFLQQLDQPQPTQHHNGDQPHD